MFKLSNTGCQTINLKNQRSKINCNQELGKHLMILLCFQNARGQRELYWDIRYIAQTELKKGENERKKNLRKIRLLI